MIDILSRLVETVAESNDDMQGYVTEILLTLTHNIDAVYKQITGIITSSIPQPSPSKESTNTVLPSTLATKIETLQNRLFPNDRQQTLRTFRRQSREHLSVQITPSGMMTAPTSPRNFSSGTTSTLVEGQSTTTICPSVSSQNGVGQRSEDQQMNLLRASPDPDRESLSTTSTLTRSRSAQNVRQQTVYFPNPSANVHSASPTNKDVQSLAASIDDAKTVLAQLFWLAVCLLESDYEYEFTLSVKMLTTIIDKVQLNTYDYVDRITNILKSMKWQNFPGLHALALKGCTSPITFDSTMTFLGCLTTILQVNFISTTNSSLAINVVALLPNMMYNYDNQHPDCIQAAERMARGCQDHDDDAISKNLVAVMQLYAQGKFGSSASQWAKCVLKYLTDVYMAEVTQWIRLLCEILDNGPHYLQMSIIDIFYHLVMLIDTKSISDYGTFNNELVRNLCKYVNRTDFCAEVTKILKLLIQRSSTLSTPKHIPNNALYNTAPLVSHMGKVEFPDAYKSSIELPGKCSSRISFNRYLFAGLGRTLDIEYNLSAIMNAIKTKEQQNQTINRALPSISISQHRRRPAFVNGVLSLTDSETNHWKQNAAQSQVNRRL